VKGTGVMLKDGLSRMPDQFWRKGREVKDSRVVELICGCAVTEPGNLRDKNFMRETPPVIRGGR